MTKQHKALELAELLRTRNGSATGFGLGLVCDEAAAELRRQHALIVQMREAMADLDASVYMDDAGQYRLTKRFTEEPFTNALTAATQYLEQP